MLNRCPFYSVPIILPIGLKGDKGDPANDGADGVAILENTIAVQNTFSAIGDQVVKTYSLAAASCSAGDIIILEALISASAYSLGLVSKGKFYFTFGGVEIASIIIDADSSLSPGEAIQIFPTSQAKNYFKLVAAIVLKTTSTEEVYRHSSYNAAASVAGVQAWSAPLSISVDTVPAVTIQLKADIDSGTVVYTCNSLIITKYKK